MIKLIKILNEIIVNKPTKPRVLVGPYGENTTNINKFIKTMETYGYPLIKIYNPDDEEIKSSNPIFDFSWKIGLPKFKGLNGPMKDSNSIYYETWEQNKSMWESTNITSYDNNVTEKVIKGFKLIPFKQGFGKSFKSISQKASPQLAERINKWIKKEFPESKVTAKYENTYQTINFLYPKITNEITVNKPTNDIVKFLNRHKQEVWDKIVSNEISEEDTEFYNLPKNLNFITYTTGEGYTVITVDKFDIGLDFSFNKEDVTEEDNTYIETNEIKIAGKTIYYCRYSI
jgi:hypothetical protein